eukprot:scaffold285439_cov36-Tisochrysis_lutea.AAC.3
MGTRSCECECEQWARPKTLVKGRNLRSAFIFGWHPYISGITSMPPLGAGYPPFSTPSQFGKSV